MMQNNYCFKDIFTSVSDLEKAITPIMTVNKDRELQFFILLDYAYHYTPIAYNTPDIFVNHFVLTYTQECDNYINKINSQKDLQSMTINDYTASSVTINNISDTPATQTTDAFKIQDYVNQQNVSTNKLSTVEAYLRRIRSLKPLLFQEFIEKFKKHFRSIY